MIRIVHASADAPAVDAYAKGSTSPIVTGLAYGQTSSWIEVDSGTVEVELRASPSKSTDPLVYTTGALTLADQSDVTAVAAGLLASDDASNSFRVIPLANNFAAATPGTTRVRILHAGSDAPAVDLDVGNDDPANPEVKALARFSDTGEAGIALPSDTSLAIGIDVGGARVTQFTTPALADGKDLLVIATGLLADLPRQTSGFGLLVVGPNGNLGMISQDPTIYTLHASPDASAVDAYVGETKIIDDLAFGKLTAPIQVQPSTYSVDVFVHQAGTTRPASAPVFSASTGALAAGQRYLTVVTGFAAPKAGQKGLMIDAMREQFTLGSSSAALRADHASPDAPAVDIGVIAGTSLSPVVFGDLSFGGSSAEAGFIATPGTIPTGIATAGNDSSIALKFALPATASERAFVIADGALAPAAGQQAFRLAVVRTESTPWTVSHVFHE